MTNALYSLNVLAVLAAFAPYFVLGALWFTVFFKNAYQKALGRGPDATPANAPIFIIGPAVCSLVVTVAADLLMQRLTINSAGETFAFAMVIGLGFLVANTVNIAINPNIPKPIFYSLITGSYHLVGFTMACFILYGLQ
ncbi:hypothetical protein BGP77_15850 [Saccharospirillum sp. MSK14-1]|uniref:DUF1761 domain-containing protein n=1 Tax=Saccharospirillum sp. MSK14-1 TaxID=1897632 RepID=UPI000D3473EC|nr:DUF1761 domain-containing protein [Saccharospirillum sp. MSK14-1]PTY37932.1 hypothetical protein BGP77_15850 [Saccharospirillum sp. MSK14-1]